MAAAADLRPSGFVESQGAISIEAAHTSRNTSVSDIIWTELPGLGKTLSGITPLPRSDQSFDIGAGPTVFVLLCLLFPYKNLIYVPSSEYDFLNFNTIGGSGNISASILLSPSLNAATDQKPLAFGVALDGGTPIRVQPVPPSSRKGDPPGWATNDGWVANAINNQTVTFTGVTPGAHTLKISMIEPGVVVQKIVISECSVSFVVMLWILNADFTLDAGGLVNSYLGPPESKRV